MHTSNVRVTRVPLAVGGWRGRISLDGDGATIEPLAEGKGRTVVLSGSGIKRASFNSANGLWAFRLKEGGKIHVQSSGSLLSADRTPAGKETNRLLSELLDRHGVRGFRL
ncbi:MAG: hypothetical protein ACT4QG_04515 [Sporichthyaceae bacterium]